jgi:hypothetical protein
MSRRWLVPSADQCRHGERAGVRAKGAGGQAEGRGRAGGQVRTDLLKEHEV